MDASRFVPKPLRRIHWKSRLVLWHLNRHLRQSVTLQTKQGIFTLPLDTDDGISRHLFSRREFELELISKSLSFLRRIGECPQEGQGTVLDVGANNGVISIGMLATGEFQRAIAIEADPQNFSLLQANVLANGFEDRFRCLNFAAADVKSTLQFELSEKNSGDHRVRMVTSQAAPPDLFLESGRRVIQVEAETIDNLLARIEDAAFAEPSLLWVDVQGYEGFVFRGARRMLSKGVPVMAEIWPYGIVRTGMSLAEFGEIARGIWSTFWIERRTDFSSQPIEQLPKYLDRLGIKGNFKNVLFTK